MANRPHVALIIESSRAYGRGLLAGIARYARTHGPWSLYLQERGLDSPVPDWLPDWQGDGIIARVESMELERAILEKGIPAIDLRGKFDLRMPLIETNDRTVARLAAEHLLERGFRQVAYCGFAGLNYSLRRLRYFPAIAHEAGVPCHVFPVDHGDEPVSGDRQQARELHGILYEDELVRWIESLPKPIGIMACNDIRGQQVLNACRSIGVAVPDEVAVIGVDNDEVLCELSDPPLSSVEPATMRIGFEAASLLDRLMQRGGDSPPAKSFIDPRGVVVRQSTEVTAIEDRDIAAAVRYIRDHACQGVNVEDVLQHVPLSRSTFDRKFRKAIGRTAKREILRVQIRRARQLLSETEFSLDIIARMTGFKHTEYFCNAFKRETGQTPGSVRNA